MREGGEKGAKRLRQHVHIWRVVVRATRLVARVCGQSSSALCVQREVRERAQGF